MHAVVIRLLISGASVLENGLVTVDVGPDRERLLAIKRGEIDFAECDVWRKELQTRFTTAFENTKLPERPDYEKANALLIKARRLALEEQLP